MKFLNDLKNSYPELEPAINDITKALSLLLECAQSGGTILACGNGGSAADAHLLLGICVSLECRLRTPVGA